ncbi:MAG: DUF1638 domain-containing protein [Spirochaetaceae bacterium]|nr:DUF1638 domain-containing protein [Spirochaetaceae bacterium]
MTLSLISCGVFRHELERVLPDIEAELGCRIETDFLTPALDEKADLLEKSVSEKLEQNKNKKNVLLYGGMCHTEWPRITEKSGAVYPKASNCAEMMLSPEKKKEFDAKEDVYFITLGSLKQWKEIYQQGHGWEAADARVNFSYFEKIIVLDSGIFEISDEELFEFFDFAQVPIETMKISLDYFKSVVLDLCRKQLAA